LDEEDNVSGGRGAAEEGSPLNENEKENRPHNIRRRTIEEENGKF